MASRESTVRLERTWALDAAAFAIALANLEPEWGSETFGLAGGQAVLCGPGMYVNRAIAVGLEAPIDDREFEMFEQRCVAVGVLPSVEVSHATHPGVVSSLAERGYSAVGSVAVLTRDASLPSGSIATDIATHPANSELLGLWQSTSALGWGHTSAEARRAGDAFARAAAEVDGDGMIVATRNGKAVGCASITIRGGIATLGGMSTVPEARGTGVQSALIRHRLERADAPGCDLAATSCAIGGASERNLIRAGFARQYVKTTYQVAA